MQSTYCGLYLNIIHTLCPHTNTKNFVTGGIDGSAAGKAMAIWHRGNPAEVGETEGDDTGAAWKQLRREVNSAVERYTSTHSLDSRDCSMSQVRIHPVISMQICMHHV